MFDAVGGDTLQRSWGVLAPGGRLVTIAADSEGAQDERTKTAFFIVEPAGAQLAEIARSLESGELRCLVGAEVPLASASDAYRNAVPSRHGPGKMVISMEA